MTSWRNRCRRGGPPGDLVGRGPLITVRSTGLTTTLPAGSKVNTAIADVIGANDVIGLQNALPPRFQPRARWIANLSTINKLAGLET